MIGELVDDEIEFPDERAKADGGEGGISSVRFHEFFRNLEGPIRQNGRIRWDRLWGETPTAITVLVLYLPQEGDTFSSRVGDRLLIRTQHRLYSIRNRK